MPSLWKHIRGGLDRSRNPVWGHRMSFLYGMGVWTMLGFLYCKWLSSGDAITAAHFGVPHETFKELSDEEKDKIFKAKNSAVLKRQQELAEYVAENMYSPVDFMG